jgi:uncharacterized protein (TIGR00299 family) protein
MKILYLDCFSGISGDMAVGALIDAGVPLEALRAAVVAVGIPADAVELSTRSIVRSQIHATKLDVVDHTRAPHQEGARPADEKPRQHEHAGGDEPQPHTDRRDNATGHDFGEVHHHRTFREIAAAIEQSELAPRVRQRATGIFRQIALAEGRIHDTPVDDVHFHEVGALDSIADIVAFAAGLEHLGIDEVYCSTVPLGAGGTIRTHHGPMPLPSPATLEILKGLPVQLTDLPFELTTPTGAGIVKALSCGALAMDEILIERIGYGAGTRELPDRPNLLRVVIGERVAAYDRDSIVAIEANLDDLNPQIFSYLFERLLQAGANDCFVAPVLMKKGRPGHLLTVLAPTGAVAEMSRIIFAETTTIGVRYRELQRLKLPREEIIIATEFGPVRMKRVRLHGEVRTTPEYEDARRIAVEHGMPLPVVMRRLIAAAEANERM